MDLDIKRKILCGCSVFECPLELTVVMLINQASLFPFTGLGPDYWCFSSGLKDISYVFMTLLTSNIRPCGKIKYKNEMKMIVSSLLAAINCLLKYSSKTISTKENESSGHIPISGKEIILRKFEF